MYQSALGLLESLEFVFLHFPFICIFGLFILKFRAALQEDVPTLFVKVVSLSTVYVQHSLSSLRSPGKYYPSDAGSEQTWRLHI